MADRSSNFLSSGVVPLQSHDFDINFGISKPKAGNTLKDLKNQKPAVQRPPAQTAPKSNPPPQTGFPNYSYQTSISGSTSSYSSIPSFSSSSSSASSFSSSPYQSNPASSDLLFSSPASNPSWKIPSPSSSQGKDPFAVLFNDAAKSLKSQSQPHSAPAFPPAPTSSTSFKSNQSPSTAPDPFSLDSFSVSKPVRGTPSQPPPVEVSEFSDFFGAPNVNATPPSQHTSTQNRTGTGIGHSSEFADPFSEFSKLESPLPQSNNAAFDPFSELNSFENLNVHDSSPLDPMNNGFHTAQDNLLPNDYNPADEYFGGSNQSQFSVDFEPSHPPNQANNTNSNDPLFDFDFPTPNQQSSSGVPNANFFSTSSTAPNDDLFGDFISGSSHSNVSNSNAAQSAVNSAADFSFESYFSSATPATKSKANKPTISDPLEDMFLSRDEFSSSKDGEAESAWGDFVDSETVTELNALPSAPPGLTLSAAVQRGKDLQRGGQFADAIKWLTWGESLSSFETNSSALRIELFTVRAACFKEAGEMKKAVADCSKVLEFEPHNSSMLLQRAMLYESMEKYSLGLADLKELMKVDPSNRNARALMTRLNKALQ